MFKLLAILIVCAVRSSNAELLGSSTADDSPYSVVTADYQQDQQQQQPHVEQPHVEQEHQNQLEPQQPLLKTLLPDYQHTQALLKAIDYQHDPLIKSLPIHYQPIIKTVVAPISYHPQYINAIQSRPIIYKTISQAQILVKQPLYLTHNIKPIPYKTPAHINYRFSPPIYGHYHW